MTREEQMKEFREKAYKHFSQSCDTQLALEDICRQFFELGWRASDENPQPLYIVMRYEEHDDYVETVFVDEKLAEDYCKNINKDPNEYYRDVVEMNISSTI